VGAAPLPHSLSQEADDMDNKNPWLVADTMASVARTINRRISLEEALKAIAVAAQANIPGVDYAGISILHRRGRIESAAVTDPLVHTIDSLQYELKEGPCYDAVNNDRIIAVDDLATDQRWPRYGPKATALGIRSQLGIRLYEEEDTIGGLNLYCRNVNVWDAETVHMAELFAVHAATALGRALTHSQLGEAMATRQVIGHAVGIIMERYKVDPQRAFTFLVRLSQHGNVKLRDLAQDLVNQTAGDTSSS
jgi:GAF domain-containing protein